MPLTAVVLPFSQRNPPTHNKLLCYAVLKSPEFNNPLDPTSGETGNTLYGITEIYRGPEGCQAHMALGQEREKMFGELVALTSEYCVSGILGVPVIRSM